MLLSLSVSPKQKDLLLTGIPDDYVQVGLELNLTCAISRIKPEAAEMYWIIGGRTKNGSLTVNTNSDGTFSQSNILLYT